MVVISSIQETHNTGIFSAKQIPKSHVIMASKWHDYWRTQHYKQH